jgi:hypothetical protein
MLTEKEHIAALKKIKEGLATKVRILVPDDACPLCVSIARVYNFDEDIPTLPPDGCSCIQGCKAMYAPVLDQFGP